MKFIHILFRILKGLLIALFGLVGIVAVAVLVILIWPQIILNEKTLRWGAKLAEKQGIHLKWNHGDVQIESLALLKKRFIFNFKDLCVDIPENKISSCTQEVNLKFAGNFAHLMPQLLELGPIEIKDLHWKMLIPQEDQTSRTTPQITGVVDIAGRESEGNELGKGNRWVIELRTSADLPDRSQAKVEGSFFVKGGDFRNLKGTKLDELDIEYYADASYKKAKANAAARLEGTANMNRITSRISGIASRFLKEVPRVKVENCELDLNKQTSKETQLQIKCPIQVKIPVPPEQFKDLKLPTEIGIHIQSKLAMSTFFPSAETRIKGPLDIQFDPMLAPLFSGQGELNNKIDGVIGEFPDKGTVESHLALSLNVPNFQKLVHELSRGAFAIPAPFHVMKGKEEFILEGDSTLERGKFPFSLKTRLASKAQNFDLDGSGDFAFERVGKEFQPRLKFDLILSKIALVLPRLDWKAPPRLMPDGRFDPDVGKLQLVQNDPESPVEKSEKKSEKNSKKKTQPSPFHYVLTFKTPPTSPVRVLTNLTQEAIPVQLNLAMSDSTPLQGQVTVQKLPVEVFRRKAILDHFTFNLSDPIKDSAIDGKITVDYTDYVIAINVKGTIDKPFVKPTSNPPLPEDSLYATLLFGQPLDTLDSDQSKSVFNTKEVFRTKEAAGAMSLASLYVFASTPVQSVSYNGKTVAAKFRVGVGTSLTVGADTATGQPAIGFRKRLGPSWSVETDVVNPSSNIEGGANPGYAGEAYLQWSNRY